MLCSQISRSSLRNVSFLSATNISYFVKGATPDSSLFAFHPVFFDVQEQRILLQSSLKKLDSADSRRTRRRRALTASANNSTSRSALVPSPESVNGLFQPDNMYNFQEGHYDGVISYFRETHVSSWPSEDVGSLNPLLERLKGLIPDVKTQTHIIHLSTEGEIFPHVDNLDASGSWILGVSLGAPRVLRVEKAEDANDSFDVLLPSGSVYIQRDTLRFKYKHSILKNERFRGEVPTGGQRISVMLRDLNSFDKLDA